MNNHSLCPGRPGRHWRHDPDQPDLAASMPLPSASRRQPDVPLNQEAHDDRPEKVPPSQTDVFLDPSPLSYAIVQAHAWMVAYTVRSLYCDGKARSAGDFWTVDVLDRQELPPRM